MYKNVNLNAYINSNVFNRVIILRVLGCSTLFPFVTFSSVDLEYSAFTPFFPLGACMVGLSQLFDSLFNVHFAVEDTSAEELWCSDVYKLVYLPSTY